MSRRFTPLALALLATFTVSGCRCGGEDTPPAEAPEPVTVQEGSASAAPEPVEQGPCPGADPTAVALVDCEPVMNRAELDSALNEMVERYESLPGREPTSARWRNERRQRLVRSAVRQEILSRHIAGVDIDVADEEVEEKLRESLEHVFENEHLFERFLESHGKSREEYYDEIRDEIVLDRILDQRARANCPGDPASTPNCRLEPSDEDIQSFYDQNRERWREGERIRARAITVRVRSGATEEAEAEALNRIRTFRARVTHGEEDFEAVAREVSESSDRLRGGDRGWIVRGRRQQVIEDGIEDTLFDTPVGRVTEPLRTSLGYQIFLIEDHRPEGFRDLDEVREILDEPIRRRNRDRLSRELETELSESVEIHYVEDNWGLEEEAALPTSAPAPEGSE
jgi:parvulin-like peptidyl-prolyl isomerase